LFKKEKKEKEGEQDVLAKLNEKLKEKLWQS